MPFNKKTQDQYYVIGSDVSNSLSPQIHRFLANVYQQSMRYEHFNIASENIHSTLHHLKHQSSLKGLSVTTPYKKILAQYCQWLTPLASKAQAVSNIVIDANQHWWGVNLDGMGLINALRYYTNARLTDTRILILGAGGATYGIIPTLATEKPQQIMIANRHIEKAWAIQQQYPDTPISICDLSNLPEQPFDIVIQATNCPNQLSLSTRWFDDYSIGFDLTYQPSGTVFTNWCHSHEIQAYDGKSMLWFLSLKAFYYWRGIMPDPQLFNQVLT